MKTKITLLALFLVTFFSNAADLIVQENGSTGTYPTISQAITAAVNGDRIIIYPKIGDNPYIEDVTIDKSLEFASAQDAVRYKIQGNITLVPLNNRTITIIGAHLTSGSIISSGSGWRTNANIMNCLLEGGNITLNNQFYSSIVSNILNSGNITISHGRVVGNDLISDTESRISISSSTSINNDTVEIIANKCTRIICSTNNVFLNVYNNYIKKISALSNYDSFFYSFQDTTNTRVKFYNNTVLTPRSTSGNSLDRNNYFLCNSNADIRNNIFAKSTNTTGSTTTFVVTPNSAKTNNYYYLTDNNVINGSLNSLILASNPVVQSTGQLILPTPAENGAEPSFEFYDLDLTIGDAGCYGGSYTLDNYFPITGSSRVFSVDMPFGIINNGSPLQIKAEGFDR